MRKRRWTVVFVPHDAEPSRILEVSHRVVKTAVGGSIVAVAAALVIGYMTVSRTVDLSQSARLAQENARLEQQLDELNGRLATLSDTLSRISQRDARIRVLANHEPIDPQVQAAGIGGPAVGEVDQAESCRQRDAALAHRPTHRDHEVQGRSVTQRR